MISADPPNPLWRRKLDAGLKLMGIALPTHVCEQLLRFLALLDKWNRTYNLTSVRDPLEMIERHLLDSLSILDHVRGGRILDMGTGPGLPGIPLALALPQSRFILLDSNGKKIRFVRQAVLELGLANVQAVHGRIESYRPELPVDCLIARAFTSLPKMLELTDALFDADSRLLAMKGKLLGEEIAGIPPGYRVEGVALRVPASLGQRHLYIIRRGQEASPKPGLEEN
jgi:16S rRNA (guanine527-N7)-methyltransferase